jgi:glycosyltransferase involved in cell wall biosynthesis
VQRATSASQPLRVAVNATFLAVPQPDGIPRASYWLVRELVRRSAGEVEWLLFTPAVAWRDAAAELRALPNCRVIRTPLAAARPAQIGWRLLALPALARWHRAGLLFNPYGNGPLWMPPGLPLVIVNHDISWLDMPDVYSAGYRVFMPRIQRRAIQLARQVIAVSGHTAGTLVARLGLPPERVTVVYNGVDPRITERAREAELVGEADAGAEVPLPSALADVLDDRPFFLFVGSLLPRKNLARVLDAFAALRASHAPDAQIVVVGVKRVFGADGGETRRADLAGVRFAGYVDDATLGALYRRAICLVSPSLYEGFGLPIVEAMALGAPVITSNVTALPEVAGDAAVLVDPYDTDAIEQAMRRLLQDDGLRADLRARGFQRARAFTWERAADGVLAVLRRAAGVAPRGTSAREGLPV